MYLVIWEIVLYFLFVWMVFLIVYGYRDLYVYFMIQNMENIFVGYQDFFGYCDEDKFIFNKFDVGDDDIKFYDVSIYN